MLAHARHVSVRDMITSFLSDSILLVTDCRSLKKLKKREKTRTNLQNEVNYMGGMIPFPVQWSLIVQMVLPHPTTKKKEGARTILYN